MSSKNNEVIRTCVICKKKTDQKELVRLVLVDGELVYDMKRKLPGRGYYVCSKKECIEKLSIWKTKRLKRLLKQKKKR